MRIPTLLALALIVLTLTAATIFFLFRQNFQNDKVSPPSNITVSNIDSSTATISWQTDEPSIAKLLYGESETLGNEALDVRDRLAGKNYSSHFVLLKDLKEDTNYYYQVESNGRAYPEKVQKFKTSKKLKEDPSIKDHNKPLIGVVLSSNLTPVDEAIVTLKIDGASPVSTLITTAGNFILPLIDLKRDDLLNFFVINHPVDGLLLVERGSIKSEVKVSLPLSQALPKIVLGQNSDFSTLASPSAQQASSNPLDLNSDGKINTLDLSVILQSLGKKSSSLGFKKEADLNLDGVVDQKDVDLMKKAIQ